MHIVNTGDDGKNGDTTEDDGKNGDRTISERIFTDILYSGNMYTLNIMRRAVLSAYA